MVAQFKKYEIQNSGKVQGGIKGGVLNAAIGKGNVAKTNVRSVVQSAQ